MVKTSRCCSLAVLAWSSHRGVPAFLSSALSHHQSRRAPVIPYTRFLLFSTTSSTSNMSSNVATNLELVLKNVQTACEENGKNKNDVRLVAVSKTKPKELILDAYDAGHRHFGENYVQELVQKAQDLPNDIHWHFIGPLQSNKANLLVKSVVPEAASLTVETVSTLKLANKLNNAMAAVNESGNSDLKLPIFIQVNTSGEISKSGVTPSETLTLCREIVENCPLLEIRGLMTIGAPGDLNCFDILRDCRDQVQEGLGVSSLELSMGMSGDYQEAIKRGATNVRVGSTIFGERDYSNKE